MSKNPIDICEQLIGGIKTLSDEVLVSLLQEKFSASLWEPENYWDEELNAEYIISLSDHVEKRASSFIAYFLGNEYSPYRYDIFTILITLASLKKAQTFQLLYDSLLNYEETSYIFLPDNARLLSVRHELYETAAEPFKLKQKVESGNEARLENPAWPFNEDGYLEPCLSLKLISCFEFDDELDQTSPKYSLAELTYDILSSSVRDASGSYELKLIIDGLDQNSYQAYNLNEAKGCSSLTFGDRIRDPKVFYISNN